MRIKYATRYSLTDSTSDHLGPSCAPSRASSLRLSFTYGRGASKRNGGGAGNQVASINTEAMLLQTMYPTRTRRKNAESFGCGRQRQMKVGKTTSTKGLIENSAPYLVSPCPRRPA